MVFLLSSQNVIQYLLNIGVCNSADAASASLEWQKNGTNLHFMVSFPGNRKLLVKQEHPSYTHNSRDEFYKEKQFYKLLQLFPLSSISALATVAIHIDDDNSIIVYKYLINYVDLTSFYHQYQCFGSAHAPEVAISIATVLGEALATLHQTTFNHPEYNDVLTELPDGQFCYQYDNPAQGLGRLTPEIFGVVPIEALKFFVLYQRYESLATAIADLATYWHPCCLTHNNLQFDNILVKTDPEQSSPAQQPHTSMVRLVDWERCGWGDPIFDLGNLLASYLEIWLSSLIVDPDLEIEESLRLAVTPLEEIQPAMLALVRMYLQTFPEILASRSHFVPRVLQSVGLALLDRIEAMILEQKYFDNTGICMLKVAKSLLCRPQSSVLTIFGVSEVELTGIQPSNGCVVSLRQRAEG